MVDTLRVHEVSPTLTYIGKASPGSLETDAVWQLQKLETVNGTLSITYPEGKYSFNYFWNSHESYSYL
jgi:hypothetical protein